MCIFTSSSDFYEKRIVFFTIVIAIFITYGVAVCLQKRFSVHSERV